MRAVAVLAGLPAQAVVPVKVGAAVLRRRPGLPLLADVPNVVAVAVRPRPVLAKTGHRAVTGQGRRLLPKVPVGVAMATGRPRQMTAVRRPVPVALQFEEPCLAAA